MPRTLPPRRYFRIEREVVLHEGKETRVECAAKLGGRVRLTVHLPGDEPDERVEAIAGFDVTAAGAAGEPPRRLGPWTFSSEEGRVWNRGWIAPPPEQPITLRLPEPGRHLLSVAADGYRTASLSVLVEPGEVTDAEVFLQAK